MTKRGYSKKEKTAAMFLFLADVLIFLAAFLGHTYVQVDFDQLLFQLKTTSTGVPRALWGSAVSRWGFFRWCYTVWKSGFTAA